MIKLCLFSFALMSTSAFYATQDTAYAQDESAAEVTQGAKVVAKNSPAQKSNGAKEQKISDLPSETVLATVNGTQITLGKLKAILNLLPEEYNAIDDQVLINTMLRQFIDETLLVTAATEEKLLDTPDVKLLLEAIQRDSIAEIYLDRKVTEAVTPEYMQERYDQAKEGFTPIEEVSARHILVEDEETIKIIAKKLQDGAAFEELAQEYGRDGTAANGGDLGWFTKENMVKPFGEAAFQLEKGEISDPVETTYGWHIIQLDDRREREFPAFEDLKAEIQSEARNQQLSQVIEDLRANATIEVKEGFDVTPKAAASAASASVESKSTESKDNE